MNVGDKLYCIMDLKLGNKEGEDFFCAGKIYDITKFNIWLYSIFQNNFITLIEYRKLKLKKIYESR